MDRKLLNHPQWPSPYAKCLAIKLGRTHKDGVPIKRMTHLQALDLLRPYDKTIEEFVEIPKSESLIRLGCWQIRYDEIQAVCPIRRGRSYEPNIVYGWRH